MIERTKNTHTPSLAPSRSRGQRLFGWRRDHTTGLMKALSLRSDGSLWSPHLESFLVSNGKYLRLLDRFGNLRLTRADAEAQARQVEAEKARIFAEKLHSLGIDPDQLL